MTETHIDWRRIVEAAESPESVHPETRRHLESCDQCRRHLEDALSLLGLLAEARLPSPPQALVTETMTRLRERMRSAAHAECPHEETGPAALTRARQVLNQVLADLVADSLRPNFALRGQAVGVPRTLVYETADYSVAISLSQAETSPGWDILGQISPRKRDCLPPGGFAVVPGAVRGARAEVSPTGQFALKSLAPRIEQLLITIGGEQITVRIPV